MNISILLQKMTNGHQEITKFQIGSSNNLQVSIMQKTSNLQQGMQLQVKTQCENKWKR